MLAFVARRILVAIPVLIGITILSFLMVRLLPGDPVRAMSSPEELAGSPERYEERREELGLNDPLPVQYVAWVGELASGNFGFSFHRRVPVTDLIAARVGPTVILAVTGVGIALLIGVPLGVFAALRQNTWLDYFSAAGSMLAISIPSFFLALVAIFVFSLTLGVLPSGGFRSVGVDPTITDAIRHLALPAGVLSSVLVGPYVRYTRQSMLEVLRQDYMTTATAKGVPRRGVVLWHGLRNALVPLTTVVAIQIPSLLAGTVIIEQVFAWPGMGKLVIESINLRDYPVIMALVVFTAILVMVSNLLADVGAAVLDPRIRI